MEKFNKGKRDKSKVRKNYSDSDDEGNFKKKSRHRNKNNFKHKKNEEREDNKSGKLKYFIDEKGRKRYDFSGGQANDNTKKDQTKSTSLSLNEHKKQLIFPPADERTFLKGRDESEIVDVEKFKGMILPVSKVENTLNSKNKKELDEKISALGVFMPSDNKEEHKVDVFYCKTCDCVLKDNSAYIEHLNGKKRKFLSYIIQTTKINKIFK